MSANQSEIPRVDQMQLFQGGPELLLAVERVYTFEQIAQALWLSSGVNSRAAAWLGCSPNTITKRLTANGRLREIKKLAKAAKLDRCESIVNDPIDQPCIYCQRPVVGVPDFLVRCPARARIGDDGREERLAPDKVFERGREVRTGPLGDLIVLGDDGHVILVNVDPTERRGIAWKMLEASDRGYGIERIKPVEIPDSLLASIPDGQVPDVLRRLEQGETIEQILLLKAS